MGTTLKYNIAYPAGNVAPNVPLVMQTQAESVETGIDTALANYPKGLVSYVKQTSNTGAITATTIITNIATYAFKANRKYRITFSSNFYTSDTNSTFAVGISTCSTADSASLTTGLTQLVAIGEHPNVATEGRSTKPAVIYIPGSDTTLQVKAWTLRQTGTGNIVFQADASNPREIYIEDLGKQF